MSNNIPHTLKAYYITTEEARHMLIDFYTDVLVNDRQNTREVIEKGQLGTFVPQLSTLTDIEIWNLFQELDMVPQLLDLAKCPEKQFLMYDKNSNVYRVLLDEEFISEEI